MKWEDNDEVAGNGYFIGDLKSYYAMKEGLTQHFDNYIEVVKDTWAVEINIEEFHQFFIMEHPHILSIIHSKGKIFRWSQYILINCINKLFKDSQLYKGI